MAVRQLMVIGSSGLPSAPQAGDTIPQFSLSGDPTAALQPATKQYVDAHSSAGVAAITEVEIDFGPTAVKNKRFTITDAGVSASSKVVSSQSGKAATGRAADENEVDMLHLNAVPAAGSFTLFAMALTGRVSGKFKINYLIG